MCGVKGGRGSRVTEMEVRTLIEEGDLAQWWWSRLGLAFCAAYLRGKGRRVGEEERMPGEWWWFERKCCDVLGVVDYRDMI